MLEELRERAGRRGFCAAAILSVRGCFGSEGLGAEAANCCGFGIGMAEIFSVLLEFLAGGVGGFFKCTDKPAADLGFDRAVALADGSGDMPFLIGPFVEPERSLDSRAGAAAAGRIPCSEASRAFSNMEIRLPVGGMLAESTASRGTRAALDWPWLLELGRLVAAKDPGLTLRLAAKVAAMKLGLFGSRRCEVLELPALS